MANLATDKRLEKLVDLHYEGGQASAYATAYRDGWYACKWGHQRDACPHSNEYQPDLNCYDKGFYVRLYLDWNYGYDAYLKWSTPPADRVGGTNE